MFILDLYLPYLENTLSDDELEENLTKSDLEKLYEFNSLYYIDIVDYNNKIFAKCNISGYIG